MEKKYRIGPEFEKAESKSPHTILTISGWASTDDVDSYNEIVRPQAFLSSQESFMQHPLLLFGHDWWSKPIGKVTQFQIREHGLWIEAEIADTTEGRDIKALIEFGILKAFSIGFMLKEMKTSDKEPDEILDMTLLEISVVNVPADREALIEEIKKHNIPVQSKMATPERRPAKRGKTMEPEEIKELVSPLKNDVGDLKTTVADIRESVKEFATFKAEMKEMKGRATSEIEEKVDKMEADFKASLVKLDEVQKSIVEDRKNRVPFGKAEKIPWNLKELRYVPSARLKSALTEKAFHQAEEYRQRCDDLVLLDGMLAASSKGFGGSNELGQYHARNKFDRIKSLNYFKELNEFQKAMDTATATEGTEWVPTELSTKLIERVEAELKVAALFDSINMPTPTFEIPALGAVTEALISGETTTVQTARAGSGEQTWATSKITLSAEKLQGRYQISVELTEDSAIAIMPIAQREIVRSIVGAEEQAIVNGQETADIDTGYGGIGATSAKKIWDGLRYNTQTGAKEDLSTFNEDGLREMRGDMTTGGPYGLSPENLAFICSVKGYLKHFLKDLDSVQTLEKYGPNAVVLRGELGRFDNVPIIPSQYVQDNLNAAGIYDASTTDKSIVILVYKPGYIRGIRRGVEVLTERNIFFDVYDVVAYKRGDFQALYAIASHYLTSLGYGLST